jgi:GTPase SAR1 family protein
MNIDLIGGKGVGKTFWLQTLKLLMEENGPSNDEESSITFIDPKIGKFYITEYNHKFPLFEPYHVSIIMFDLTDTNSYKIALKIYKEIRKCCGRNIILIGNKTDKRGRKVMPKKIKEKMIEMDNIYYVEMSSKSLFHCTRPLERAFSLKKPSDFNM